MIDQKRAVVSAISILLCCLCATLCQADSVGSLIQQMSDKNLDVRIAAADALLKIGKPAAKPLVDAKRNMDWDAQARAEEVLVKMGPASVDALITHLTFEYHSKGTDAEHIHAMLSKIGKPAIMPLIAVLEARTKGDKAGAAQMLGELRAREAVPALIRSLKQRLPAAAMALGVIGDKRAVGPLIAVIKCENQREMVVSAAQALGTLGDARAVGPLVARLDGLFARDDVVSALAAIGKPAVDPLIGALASDDSNVRKGAVEALGRISDGRTVPALIRALSDSDDLARRWAVQALRSKKDGRAVDGLIKALDDPDKEIRRLAAEALGEIGDPRAVEPLLAAYRRYPAVQLYAAKAVAKIYPPKAVGPLVAMIRGGGQAATGAAFALVGIEPVGTDALVGLAKDSDPAVRRVVVRQMRLIRSPEIVPLLIEAMSDSSADVRLAAAGAFEMATDPRSAAPLTALLLDSDSRVRAQAAAGLMLNFSASAVEPLEAMLKDSDEHARWNALNALGYNRAAGAELLIPLIHDGDSNIRWSAIEALGKLKDARGVDALVAALRDKNPKFGPAPKRSPESVSAVVLQQAYLSPAQAAAKEVSVFRLSAARALGQIGDVRALDPLIAALKDDDERVREAAAEALGAIGDRRALDPLQAALKDTDRFVRDKAGKALKSIR